MGDTEAEHPSAFQVTAYRCRCGHEWVPHNLRSTERPRVCPKCKSPNWDRPIPVPEGKWCAGFGQAELHRPLVLQRRLG